MLNTPFSPWPSFTEEEAEAVRQVILSNRVNYWTGQECREFEREFATWCGSRFSVSMANGTLALDACIAAMDIGSGDEVIVTSRTFLASASAIVNSGAIPVFADVDRDSQNITAEAIAPLINDRTKAIVCVHLAGWPCDMKSIVELSRSHNLRIIEDCAQAHGARHNGVSVGTLGDAAAWSFCQDKIMTTGGEGGMVTTNDEELWRRIWSLKDHGKTWEAVYERDHPPGRGFRWLHDDLGHNWRMMEVQAAIGRIQLGRMMDWSKKRRSNAETIQETAHQYSCFRVPTVPSNIEHAWYKCYIFLDPDGVRQGWNRDRVMDEINELGVPCFAGSCSEVYLEKGFVKRGIGPKARLPIAMELAETSLMFLVHPTLTTSEIGKTCSALETIGKRASK